MLGIDVGGMNHVPYARAFNETDTRVTLNQRVLAVRPESGRLCAEIGSDHSAHRAVRHVDYVVADHGTAASADLYFELKPAVVEPGRGRSRRAAGRAAAVHRQQPGRPVPAVPHRRRRGQPQHPRRRLRRPPPAQRPLTHRGFPAPEGYRRGSPAANPPMQQTLGWVRRWRGGGRRASSVSSRRRRGGGRSRGPSRGLARGR